jgi:hypothetical protein
MKRMKSGILLSGLLTALSTVSAVTPAAQAQNAWKGLCFGQGEVAYAGCDLKNGRSLVFCVPKGQQVQRTNGNPETPRVSFMTYRIVKADGTVELTFPRSRAGSARQFQILSEGYARGARTQITFRRGQYLYRFEDSLIAGAQGQPHDVTLAMAVFKGGKRIANLACRQKAAAPPPPKPVSFVIIPGKSFGPITRNTTLSGLRRIFGARNVQVAMLQPPHGDFPKQRGAVIYKGTSREVEVFFKERTNVIQWVIVGRNDSVWRTNAGIRIGISLAKLERIFGAPFQISPFGRDGGGSVLAGKDVLEAKNLILRVTYPDNMSAADGKVLSSGKPFYSDNPAARRAKLKVHVIWWEVRQ